MTTPTVSTVVTPTPTPSARVLGPVTQAHLPALADMRLADPSLTKDTPEPRGFHPQGMVGMCDVIVNGRQMYVDPDEAVAAYFEGRVSGVAVAQRLSHSATAEQLMAKTRQSLRRCATRPALTSTPLVLRAPAADDIGASRWTLTTEDGYPLVEYDIAIRVGNRVEWIMLATSTPLTKESETLISIAATAAARLARP